MRRLTIVFFVLVGLIALTFAANVYSVVKAKTVAKQEVNPITIPTPATIPAKP